MFQNSQFELTLTLDSDKFGKIFDQAYNTLYSSLEFFDEDKYVDHTFTPKGLTVIYCDSQYKKKIKLIVNSCQLLDTDKPNPDKLISKLNKRIERYFNNKYQLDDFELSGMGVTVDIDVRSSEKVFDYLKVLRRIGKVKGFSPSSNNNWPDNDTGLCYDGNSNGIKFMLYDLDFLTSEQSSDVCFSEGQISSETYFSTGQSSDKYCNIGQPEYSEGILRAEVRLTKPKAIRAYTNKSSTSKQIAHLHDNRQQIFLDTFMKIIPFGNFYKKDKAEEAIRTKVKDATIGRKMLWLVGLIPEKKSLLSAQKALNERRIDKVMKAFFDIEVAPITISKRHDVKKLDNLYSYL